MLPIQGKRCSLRACIFDKMDTNERLAVLTQQMSDLKHSLDTVEDMVRNMAILTTQVAHMQEAATALQERYREVSCSVEKVSINTEAYVNKAKGALWALGILFGAIQGLLIATVMWLFTSVTDLRESKQLLMLRITTLEAERKH